MTYRPYLFVGAIAVSLAGAAIAQQQPDWDAIQVTATPNTTLLMTPFMMSLRRSTAACICDQNAPASTPMSCTPTR